MDNYQRYLYPCTRRDCTQQETSGQDHRKVPGCHDPGAQCVCNCDPSSVDWCVIHQNQAFNQQLAQQGLLGSFQNEQSNLVRGVQESTYLAPGKPFTAYDAHWKQTGALRINPAPKFPPSTYNQCVVFGNDFTGNAVKHREWLDLCAMEFLGNSPGRI